MAEPTETDVSLLAAVARDADRDAYKRLFDKHARSAVSLARRITGELETAEDAVQEAMLRVWRHASSFSTETEGNVRAWILRIVARESARLMRKRSGRRAMEQPGANVTSPATAVSPSEQAAGREERETVRRCVDALPPEARQAVALHFGAGLTHGEIGELLSLSRSSVSYKIREALRTLKGDLARAGVMSVAPLLAEEAMRDALCSEHSVSAELFDRVCSRLGESASAAIETADRSARMLARSPSRLYLAIGAIALVAAGVTGVLFWARQAKRPVPSVGPVTKTGPGLPIQWTFENGPPESFEHHAGDWKEWRPAKDGRRACLIAKHGVKLNVQRILPATVPSRPFVVTATAFRPKYHMASSENLLGLGIFWERQPDTLPTYSRWACMLHEEYKNKEDLALESPYEIKFYFIDEYVYEFHENVGNRRFTPAKEHLIIQPGNFIMAEVLTYPKPYPSKRLAMVAHSIGLEEVSIRELKDSEIPYVLRDPPALFKQMEARPHFWTKRLPPGRGPGGRSVNRKRSSPAMPGE